MVLWSLCRRKHLYTVAVWWFVHHSILSRRRKTLLFAPEYKYLWIRRRWRTQIHCTLVYLRPINQVSELTQNETNGPRTLGGDDVTSQSINVIIDVLGLSMCWLSPVLFTHRSIFDIDTSKDRVILICYVCCVAICRLWKHSIPVCPYNSKWYVIVRNRFHKIKTREVHFAITVEREHLYIVRRNEYLHLFPKTSLAFRFALFQFSIA